LDQQRYSLISVAIPVQMAADGMKWQAPAFLARLGEMPLKVA
jgi:hypothetical protein